MMIKNCYISLLTAGVPHDGVPRNHLVSVKFPLAIFYVVLGVLGITFAVGCLCFNFACRKNPLVNRLLK